MSKNWKCTFIWKCIFITIMALIFGYILLCIESLIVYNELIPETVIGVILSITSIFAIIFLSKFAIEEFKKQKIRNQPSWVYYTYFGLALTPIVSELLYVSNLFYPLGAVETWNVNPLAIRILVFLGGYVFYKIYSPNFAKVIKNAEDFAHDAVGRKDDQLNFKESARNIAYGIANTSKNISIYALNGEPGEGKSSFARMIIEYLEDDEKIILGKDNFLYTYISLTETNEEKDFSKLFSQRWAETLSKRYPKINTFHGSRMLSAILRENGQGLLAQTIECLDIINIPLLRTKKRTANEGEQREQFVPEKTAKLFGNIYEIKEKLWVIMIDEVERALFEEIYRLIEIVERLKYEGEKEFPIKVVFILCISREKLREFTDNFKEKDERAFLIRNFIIEDSKNIDKQLFLPPFDYETKKKFISTKLIEIIIEMKKILGSEIYGATEDELGKVTPSNYQNTLEQFIGKDIVALEFIIETMIYESPRVIKRCIQELEHFYHAFRDTSGVQIKKFVRFSDLLAASYARVKYPEIIELFRIKVDETFPAEEIRKFRKSMKVQNDKNQDIKTVLSNLIKDSAKWDIKEDTNRDKILKLIGFISFSFIEGIKGKQHEKNMDSYAYTLSDPQNLRDYLYTFYSGDDNLYRKLNQIYQKHRSSKKLSEETKENKYLLEYSRYLRLIEANQDNLLLDVIEELFNRLDKNKIPKEPKSMESTIYDQAVYEINFHILKIFQKHFNDKKPNATLQKAFGVFERVLTSPNITVGGKYILLRSFADYKRGGGASIHIEFHEVFKKIIELFGEEKIRELIKHTLEELHKRFIGEERDIYKEEENFFFVLFQSWSGDATNSKVEIAELQTIASRTLEQHPDAVELYWKKYPFNEEWNIDDAEITDKIATEVVKTDSLSHYELYMPIETLLGVTNKIKIDNGELNKKIKFWDKFMNNSANYKKYKELVKLKDDGSTLKAVLVEFLSAPPANRSNTDIVIS